MQRSPGRRSSLIFVALVVAMVLGAAPVAAKGPESVTLTGPGIGRPIELDTTDPGLLGRAIEQTGLWWSTGRDRPLRVEERPPGDLGPGYTLSWHLYEEPRENAIRQVVYPFAPGTVVVHTPIQDAIAGEAEGAGWFEAPALGDTLARLGLPVGGVSSTDSAPPRGVADPSPERPPVAAPNLVVVGLSLVASVVVALAAGHALWRRAQAESNGALTAR